MPIDQHKIQAEVHRILDGRKPVFVMRHGSFLHGTETPQSDIDIKVVFLPTSDDILLGNVDFSLSNNPKSLPMAPGDLDIHCYSLARYLTLLARFDIVALEMLFASNYQDAIIHKHSIFDEIYAARMDLIATGKHPLLSNVRANLGKFMPDHVVKKSRTEKVTWAKAKT